jgi:hypothetical protein
MVIIKEGDEMKFRAYDKQEKKLYKPDTMGELFYLFALTMDGRLGRFNEDLGKYETCDPDRYVVEFSTGAFEFDDNRKNGKEMFQGDVVRCDCFESHEIYIVEIDNFKKMPDEMTGSKCNSRQIIGNIHGEADDKI